MKGKWAQGIVPRYFTWIIKDQLAVCERLGGYGANHRKVRRQEEIIWVREQGFTRIVSLLADRRTTSTTTRSSASRTATSRSARTTTPTEVLPAIWDDLQAQLANGDKIIVHHDELGDRMLGVLGGYLIHAGLVPEGPRATAMIEQLARAADGPAGRELVAIADPPPRSSDATDRSSCAACGSTPSAASCPTSARRPSRSRSTSTSRPTSRRPARATTSPTPSTTARVTAEAERVATTLEPPAARAPGRAASPTRSSRSTSASTRSPSPCASSSRPCPSAWRPRACASPALAMTRAFLALGSNLGDRAAHLRDAVAAHARRRRGVARLRDRCRWAAREQGAVPQRRRRARHRADRRASCSSCASGSRRRPSGSGPSAGGPGRSTSTSCSSATLIVDEPDLAGAPPPDVGAGLRARPAGRPGPRPGARVPRSDAGVRRLRRVISGRANGTRLRGRNVRGRPCAHPARHRARTSRDRDVESARRRRVDGRGPVRHGATTCAAPPPASTSS